MLKTLHPLWVALLTVVVGLATGLVVRIFVDLSWGWIVAAVAFSTVVAVVRTLRERRVTAGT